MGVCASSPEPTSSYSRAATGIAPRGSALGEARSGLDDSDAVVTAGGPRERNLLSAAAAGDLSGVERLISGGVNVNFGADLTNVPTALHEAVKHGHAAVVARLLELGARVDATDAQGMSPMHVGARKPHVGTMRLLLTAPGAGRAINWRDRGKRTALMYLAAKKQRDLYHEYVAAGADESIADASGNTARHVAVQNGIISA